MNCKVEPIMIIKKEFKNEIQEYKAELKDLRTKLERIPYYLTHPKG